MFEIKHIEEFPKPYKYTPYEKNNFGAHIFRSVTNLNLKVCKVIVLGDLCVGKTSLLNRFCYKIFDSGYRSTIGVDFQAELINIKGHPYHLQIWDTAGQERFKCIAQCYYRKAHVFDLSSIRTLGNCGKWLNDALEVASVSESPYIFLIGTKKDLLAQEACKNAEDIAVKVAQKLKAEFWSVSAKTGENIDKMFLRAAALMFDSDVKFAVDNFEKKLSIGDGALLSFKKQQRKDKKRVFKCWF